MSEPSRCFVLKYTFENVNRLTSIDSPSEHHFGYDWFCRVVKTGEYLEAYLNRETKEEDMPPVTVSFSISIKSIDGKETVREEDQNTFVNPYGWGWPSFEKWDKVRDNFISNDKLTVEIHVNIIKVFTVATIEREFILIGNVQMNSEFKEWSCNETHFDIPWKFSVKREEDNLEVNLICEKTKRSNLWSIDAKYTFQIKTKDGDVIEKKRAFTFNEKNKFNDVAEFAGWDDVVNKCIENEMNEVKVHVEILNMVGISQKREANFESSENDEYSDVCLRVGGKVFKANKGILARFSPVFRLMFFGRFDEAKSKEVVIENIDADSFGTFLSLIYVYKSEINSENVRNLLILADRYDVPRVTNKCQKFLLKSNDVCDEKKLQLADQFHLADVQEHVLDSLKTGEQVKVLRDKMGPMNDTTASALLDKAISFIS